MLQCRTRVRPHRQIKYPKRQDIASPRFGYSGIFGNSRPHRSRLNASIVAQLCCFARNHRFARETSSMACGDPPYPRVCHCACPPGRPACMPGWNTFTSPMRQGWECPRCHAVNAPDVQQCACSAATSDTTRLWIRIGPVKQTGPNTWAYDWELP